MHASDAGKLPQRLHSVSLRQTRPQVREQVKPWREWTIGRRWSGSLTTPWCCARSRHRLVAPFFWRRRRLFAALFGHRRLAVSRFSPPRPLAQIRGPKHLRDLCLVSKFFHSEFIVYLYRELDTPIERLKPASRRYIHHTRSLIARSCIETRDNDHDAFNEVAQELVRKMPLLETFA